MYFLALGKIESNDNNLGGQQVEEEEKVLMAVATLTTRHMIRLDIKWYASSLVQVSQVDCEGALES